MRKMASSVCYSEKASVKRDIHCPTTGALNIHKIAVLALHQPLELVLPLLSHFRGEKQIVIPEATGSGQRYQRDTARRI